MKLSKGVKEFFSHFTEEQLDELIFDITIANREIKTKKLIVLSNHRDHEEARLKKEQEKEMKLEDLISKLTPEKVNEYKDIVGIKKKNIDEIIDERVGERLKGYKLQI